MTIRNPIEWGASQVRLLTLGRVNRGTHRTEEDAHVPLPTVRRIKAADLWDVLASGFSDFGANRTDVIFLCVMYPVIGLVLGRLAAGYEMLPLLFPLASGFALIGPFAALGLYEMSRRHEQGIGAGWTDAFGVLRSPSLGSILLLGLLLTAIYVIWLVAAYLTYKVTLGPQPPASMASFVHDVFTTGPGWALILIGVGVGFLFAVLVLAISVVAFPLLLDRDVRLVTAVGTSIRAVVANPGSMALWGLIVAGSLVIGSIPLFVGLVVVLPVLGHSTWHLYRKVVPRAGPCPDGSSFSAEVPAGGRRPERQGG
jgi:uncharacterized membrane protein